MFTMARGYSFANYGWDGGDLLSAAYSQGLAHPPGFALYIILLGMLMKILPIDPAIIGNGFSAVCAGATLFFVYITIEKLTNKPWIPAIGACTLAVSEIFWSQATITEISSLNALFISLLIYLAITSTSLSGKKFLQRIALIAFVFGLGTMNHLTIVLMAPGLLYWFFLHKQLFKNFIRSGYWIVTLAFIAGLTPIYYILSKRLDIPFVNWGMIDTWPNLFSYLTAQAYHTVLTATSIYEKLFLILQIIGATLAQLKIFSVGLLSLCIIYWQDRKKETACLFIVFLSYFGFSVFYSNITAFNAYILPVFLLSVILSAIGTDYLLENSYWHISEKDALFKNKLIYLFLLINILFLGILNYPHVNASEDTRAENLGKMVFDSLPDKSIVILGQLEDERNSSLRFYQVVRVKRKDVLLIGGGIFRNDKYLAPYTHYYPWLNWNTIGPVSNDTEAENQMVKFIDQNKKDYPVFLFHKDPVREGEYVEWQNMNFYSTKNEPVYRLIF